MRKKASVSLDLDNKWSYLKVHGDLKWESYPSYLDLVMGRTLDVFRSLGLKVTYFIVGKDAELEGPGGVLRGIAKGEHDVGNHSFNHEPWLHLYSALQLQEELDRAHNHIIAATGLAPIGFRGPGFSLSQTALEVMCRQQYLFDASTFPSILGPLARAYYISRSRLKGEDRRTRGNLFGNLSDGCRPLKPYRIAVKGGWMLEIPVTTVPIFRVPFHLSYYLYLASFSEAAAKVFFRGALNMCRVRGVEPSLLLHPLDFLGVDDESELRFFPAMGLASSRKLELTRWALTLFRDTFEVMSLNDYARMKNEEEGLPAFDLLAQLPE